MESIAILKPNMGVLSQKRLALSPFGALAQEFAEELLARAKREEGAWSYVPLDLLEEETAQPAPIQQTTVLQVDLKLVLEALKRETVRTEQLRATERIVERLLQRQKARQEKTVPPASTKPEAASHTPAPKPVTPFQQTLFQTIHQNIHLHLPEQNSLPFSGQSGVVRLTAPGQLGQRASEFSQALRVLREEGKSFAAEEQEAAKNRARSDERRRPQELTFREDSEKETPIQSHSASEARLLRTAERLERMLSSETQSQTHPEKQRTQTVPTAQAVGPKQENPLPEKAVLQKSASGSLHTTNQSNQALPKVGEHAIETTARQIGTETAQKSGPAARDIRTVTPKTPEGVQAEAGEASTQVQLAPAQEAAQVSAPLPGVELTYRTEEGKKQEEATSPSKQPERSAKSTLAEIKQSSSSERKSAPKSPESEMGQTAQAIPTAIPSTLEHIQKESGVQTPSATVPGTIPAVQKTVEQSAKALADIEQRSSGEEKHTSQTATGRTVRDIRTVTLKTPDGVQAEAGGAGTQAPSTPAQEAAQVSAPLPSVELTYRTEEGKEQEATSPSKQPERSAKSTLAETKQPSSSERKSVPKSPKSEMGRTAQEIRTAMPSTPEHIQKESGVQTPSATVPGTIPAVQKTVEQSAKALADIEQRSSGEEKHTSQTATGRTVRDIRTVAPATLDSIQAEAGKAGTQAPSVPVQEAAQVSAPLPGVDLTYRTEEGKEQEGTSQTGRPERSARSAPAETEQSSSSTERHTSQPATGQTVRDIRTVAPATLDSIQMETGKAGTQALSAPAQEAEEVSAPLPGVDLTYRTEEGKEQKEATSQTARLERSAKSAPAKTKQSSSSTERHTSQTEVGRTVRDIRTVAPTTLDSIQAETGEAGAQVLSASAQETAQVSVPLPGVELTYRAEESDKSHRPAMEKGQVSSFQERGETPPRTEGGRTRPGRHVWKKTPHPASTWTDIRVSRNLLHGASPAFAPEGERLWKTAPESVPPQAELDYGGGQEHTPQPSTARGPFVQRPVPPDDAEEPVPLTYGPTAALANQTPPPEPQSHSAPEESEFVRSLPDWARRFLRENAAGTEPQSMGVARNISALPEQPGEQIQWTAPNYQPTEPLAHREKQLEEPPRQAQPVRISEAEIQRTADRVYRMIEERIREDRIRLGR